MWRLDPWRKRIILLLILLELLSAHSLRADSVFLPLKLALVKSGFDKKVVEELYASPYVRFLPGLIKTCAVYKESKLNYKHFLEKKYVEMGKNYLARHIDVLTLAEKRYGVSKEVITAIIGVESHYGRFSGRYRVFNVLSTLALPAFERNFAREFHLTPSQILHLKRKSKWAYSQLKAFIIYTQKGGLDPFSIRGSVFGAFGVCQFVPSSVLKYGCDGNQDGRIDLFEPADAIMSIANYLAQHGWSKATSTQGKQQVLMSYNASPYYVHTVLQLAILIKSGP